MRLNKAKRAKQSFFANKQTTVTCSPDTLNPVASFIRSSLSAGLLFGLYAGQVSAEVLPNFSSTNSTIKTLQARLVELKRRLIEKLMLKFRLRLEKN